MRAATCEISATQYPDVALLIRATGHSNTVMRGLGSHQQQQISVFQKYHLTPPPNHLHTYTHPVPMRGALAIVTNVDGVRWTRQRRAR